MLNVVSKLREEAWQEMYFFAKGDSILYLTCFSIDDGREGFVVPGAPPSSRLQRTRVIPLVRDRSGIHINTISNFKIQNSKLTSTTKHNNLN